MTYFSLTIGISTLTLYVCIHNPASEFQLFYSSRIAYYSSHTDVCEGFDIKKNAFIFMERIHVFKAVTSLYHLIKELQDVIDIVTWPNTFFWPYPKPVSFNRNRWKRTYKRIGDQQRENCAKFCETKFNFSSSDYSEINFWSIYKITLSSILNKIYSENILSLIESKDSSVLKPKTIKLFLCYTR